ncbi:magnesium/cobalt transporter CorA [Lutibacter sp. TH_r2]|uniref:magnesium/cobalt transporter CorA n=1 Tax=Lutibacter sp. TH_r2 TaxID=3082083 RepID=UPI002952B661|nr:magnesium/cobalt transporter CorA [Lutibacter sp. TH_r2]MDV7186452.1 magnesium/cobalt transporter CorA [Lutibacter sp. TH_r2]
MKKQKKNRKIGLAPGTVVYTGYKPDNDLFINVFDYSKSEFNEFLIDDLTDLQKFENKKLVTWLNVNGLNHTSTIKEIAKYYDLHHLITEDIPNTYQRTKVDISEDHIFVVFKMLHYSINGKLNVEHISFVLGEQYLLSFQEAEGDVFNSIRDRIRNGKGLVREKNADYLLYLLLDAIVDNYYHIIDTIGEKVDSYENKILNKNNEDDLTLEIQNLKREILKLRKVTNPLKDVVNKFYNRENKLISKETFVYFSDLEDHLIQVIESLDIYREMTVGLMEMQLTVVSNRMNEVMKVLTIIATIFIPMTFLAGVYGMNFKYIPELDYKYAYFIFWAIVSVLFILLLFYFKRKKWF